MPNAFDPAPRRPLTRAERWGVVIASALFTLAIAADLADSATPAVWTVLFVLLWWAPLLVLHELGHAVVARAVGWHVHEIAIGFGRPLLRFRVGSTRVVIRTLPLEGFVVPVPKHTRAPRLTNAAVYAAGPGIELLVLLGIVAGVGWDTLLSRTDDMTLLIVQSLAVAIALGLFFNLLPHYSAQGRPNDGLGILLSAFLTPEHASEASLRPTIDRVRELVDQGDFDRALALVSDAAKNVPDSPSLIALRARCLAAQGHSDEAVTLLDELGENHDSHPARTDDRTVLRIRSEARAEIALESPMPVLLRDAELGLDAAIRQFPDAPELEILLGAVLVERRRYDEAIPLLERNAPLVRDTRDEARALGYLALASHRVGNHDHAVRYFERFRECDVPARLLSRVKDELTAPTIQSDR